MFVYCEATKPERGSKSFICAAEKAICYSSWVIVSRQSGNVFKNSSKGCDNTHRAFQSLGSLRKIKNLAVKNDD